jgi:isoleucyl-tRNA synthetase
LKFPVSVDESASSTNDYFLVWTTTPWTLTANVALAVNPELVYVRAKTDDTTVILSKGTFNPRSNPVMKSSTKCRVPS